MPASIIICKDCGKKKPLHGHGFCRVCYHRDWRRKNPDKDRKALYKWRKNHREKFNAYQRNYWRNNPEKKRAARKIYRAKNNDYINKKNAEWRRNNRRKHIQNALEWRKNNPEKAKEVMRRASALRRARRADLPATLTKKEWREILNRFDHRCAYCQTYRDRFSQDHVIPASKGGGYTKDNIVPACRSCNSAKQTKSVIGFAKYMKSINKPLDLHPELIKML